MGDKVPLTRQKKIKIEGYFNLPETYHAVRDYLEKERAYDWGEDDVTEKNDGNHRHLLSILSGDFYYADYFKIMVDIELELDGEEVEIEVDGKKTLFVKGYAKLDIVAHGDANWYDKRSLEPFMNFVAKMMDKFHGRDTMKSIKKKANEDIDGVIDIFKRHVRARL